MLPWGLCCPARPYLVELGWDSGLSRELRPSYGILVATTFLKRLFGHLVWRRWSWRCWLNLSFLVLKPKNWTSKMWDQTWLLQKTVRILHFSLPPRCHWSFVVHFPPRSSSRNLWRNGRQKSLLLELTLRQKASHPKKTLPAESGFLKNWVVVSNIFIFTPIWGRFPFWLIFFRWVETTN